jgi:hypothetical protein
MPGGDKYCGKKMKEGREMDMQICKFIESGH